MKMKRMNKNFVWSSSNCLLIPARRVTLHVQPLCPRLRGAEISSSFVGDHVDVDVDVAAAVGVGVAASAGSSSGAR